MAAAVAPGPASVAAARLTDRAQLATQLPDTTPAAARLLPASARRRLPAASAGWLSATAAAGLLPEPISAAAPAAR